MCEVCGYLWCVAACPRYEEAEDPRRQGNCRQCGAPLFERERALCAACERAEAAAGADEEEAYGIE